MYSYEIQNLMEKYNYNLPSTVYIDIVSNSPQISEVKFTPYDAYYERWTKDNAYWKFNVHLGDQ